MNNEELNKAISDVAKKYGFEQATIDFGKYDDFKFKWERSYKWINLHASDYLDKAPIDVIVSISEHILKAVTGNNPRRLYPQVFREYINSEEFLNEKTPVFLKRHNLKEATPEILEKVQKVSAVTGIGIPDIKIFLSPKNTYSVIFNLIGVTENVSDGGISTLLEDLGEARKVLFSKD